MCRVFFYFANEKKNRECLCSRGAFPEEWMLIVQRGRLTVPMSARQSKQGGLAGLIELIPRCLPVLAVMPNGYFYSLIFSRFLKVINMSRHSAPFQAA